ncbi:hypothetical protein QBC46DRAFT_458301 [Diplogelasinospora grovesii]|uniref:LysM domain-containing protein n=1 Tax=Diplogelasinospora grovesii TaxID=303347 RepID=A0AAN6NAE7_9PEZI|nr:hypothetical protein QBC46DRAFT_458301 [Diplogelasinospora grovesii]
MKPFRLISSALALRLAEAYLVAPPGTPAPGATSSCSEWVQQSYGLTCAIIEQFYGMTAAQFESWNPSTTEMGPGCNLIRGLYYCVQVNYVSYSFLSTGPPTTSTQSPATTTSSGNGISTPTPTQTGMVSNCNKFYDVVSGDGCYNIATANGISLDDFYAWNPAVGTNCTSLWPDYYVCVGITGSASVTATPISTTPTTVVTSTTSSGNGISTPTPTQTGMVSNCDDFYDVVSGDGCYNIAAANNITLDDFYAWNPAVGTNCTSLWPDYYVCVGITASSATPTTTPPPSSTSSGNGISTPTPTQTGMVDNCNSFYDVVSGDSCYNIAAANNITLDNFYAWNPAVGSSCGSLWLGYYVCVGIL